MGERDEQQSKGDFEWEREPTPLQWTSSKIPSQICLKQWIRQSLELITQVLLFQNLIETARAHDKEARAYDLSEKTKPSNPASSSRYGATRSQLQSVSCSESHT
ncbi:hypothetical protein ACFX2A_022700 [Malus domestica]